MGSPLRLAVDARVVARDTRGIGRYARAILRRLAVRDDVELTLLDFGPFAFRHRRPLTRALGTDRFRVASSVGRKCDVVWHPANGTFFPSDVRSVVTIHDAVPFRYPDVDERKRDHAQAPFLASVRSASQFIAVSEFGRGEIESVFGVDARRISVIYHGVEPAFSPGSPTSLPAGIEDGRYFLFVGDPIGEPRKNFHLFYDAYSRAWPNGDGPAIVVAGPRAPALRNVVHVGEVGDDLAGTKNEHLVSFYRGARALALASYHETFGMPMIESMACGTPVVASRGSCLPEIGADAALYAPPNDADAWAVQLKAVASDDALAGDLRKRGLSRARAFDWDTSARAHFALFSSL